MKCNHCNCQVADGVRYCPNCGAPMPQQPPRPPFAPQKNDKQPSFVPQQPQHSKNNTTLIIVLAVAFAVICGLLLFIFLGNGKESDTTEQTANSNTVDEVSEIEGVGEIPVVGVHGDEHTYDWLSERAVTMADLVGRPAGELRLMRNWIFARHGYIFKSADLRDYFDGLPWYTPKYQNVDKYLSSLELQNISTIKKYETGGTSTAASSQNKTGSHRNIGFTDDYSDWVCYTRLTDADVAGLNKQELRILRNTIYARHGRKFKSADLRNYFCSFSWYVPRYDEVSVNSLSSVEKHNIELIQRYE